MNLNTPLPISFANHTGIASKLKINNVNKPIHKASLNTYEQPVRTVCIKIINSYWVQYRVNWESEKSKNGYGGWTRYSMFHMPIDTKSSARVEYSGTCPSFDDHNLFTESVQILHPNIVQLFSR